MDGDPVSLGKDELQMGAIPSVHQLLTSPQSLVPHYLPSLITSGAGGQMWIKSVQREDLWEMSHGW